VIEPGSQGVVFLPHLVYGPPPDPDTASRGAFIGLTAHVTRAALYRAVLEGLALQMRVMLEAMAALPGIVLPSEIRAIGGNARNPLFMAIKANVYGRPVTVVDEPEASALGAALLGGIAAGLWPDLDAALAGLDRRDHVVEPRHDLVERYDALRESVFAPIYGALKPLNDSWRSSITVREPPRRDPSRSTAAWATALLIAPVTRPYRSALKAPRSGRAARPPRPAPRRRRAQAAETSRQIRRYARRGS